MDPSRFPPSPIGPSSDKSQKANEKNEPKTWWDYVTWDNVISGAKTLHRTYTLGDPEKKQILENAENALKKYLPENEAKMMIKFSEMISILAGKKTENIDGLPNFVKNSLDLPFITKAIITQAFANLSEKFHHEKESIPNYDQQTALANLFSLLVKNGGKHLTKETLEKTEADHQFSSIVTKINDFHLKFKPNEIDDLNKQLNECIFQDKKDLLALINHSHLNKSEIDEYMRLTDQLKNCYEGLRSSFKLGAKDLITYIFPKGANDPALAKFIDGEGLFKTATDLIEDEISNFMCQEYFLLRKEVSAAKHFEEEISIRVGENYDKKLLEIPSEIISSGSRYLMNFNPIVLETLSENLEPLFRQGQKTVTTDKSVLEKPKEQIQQEMDLQRYSSWILDSIKDISNTKDESLQDLMKYGKNYITELSKAIVGKGISIFIPHEKQIQEGEFLNELAKGIDKETSLEKISTNLPQKVNAFIKDLPLPHTLKTEISNQLKDSETIEKQLKNAIKNSENILEESKNELLKYKSGDLIFSFIETISHELSKKVLDIKSDISSTDEIDDMLQNLLNEFLPNLELDDHLKNSLKTNLENFKNSSLSTNSINYLKSGVEIVLTKAILQVIKRDFKKNENMIDQFFSKIESIFKNRFEKMSDDHKIKLENAIKIQSEIDELNGEIEILKNQTPSNIKRKISEIDVLLKASQLKISIDKKALNILENWQKLNQGLTDKVSDDKQIALLENYLGAVDELEESELKQQIPSYYNEVEERFSKLTSTIHQLQKDKDNQDLRNKTKALHEELKLFLNKDLESLDESKTNKLKEKRELLVKELDKNELPKGTSIELEKAFNHVLVKKTRLRNVEEKIVSLENECFEAYKKITKVQNLLTFEEIKELLQQSDAPAQEKDFQNFSAKNFKYLQEMQNILTIIQGAEKEYKIRSNEFLKTLDHVKTFKDKDTVKLFNQRLNNLISLEERIQINKEIVTKKEHELSENLDLFKDLSSDFSKLIGIDKKENLIFQNELLDKAWPIIEDAKKAFLPKLLFRQIAPIYLAIHEKDNFKTQLMENKENEVIVKLVETISKKIFTQILPEIISDPEKINQIMESITDLMPPNFDPQLKTQLKKQIQALFSGNKSPILNNHAVLEAYLEGLLFKIFLRVPDLKGSSVLSSITKALQEISEEIKKTQQNNPLITTEIIQKASDKLIKDTLNIQSTEDLQIIPQAIRKPVYDQLYTQVETVLATILVPELENQSIRDGLEGLSGSTFFTNLSKAISFDALNVIKKTVGFEALTEIIREKMDLSHEMKELLIVEFNNYFKSEGEASILIRSFSENILLNFFTKIAEKNLPVDGLDSFQVLTRKILVGIEDKYQKFKNEGKPFEEFAEELQVSLLKEEHLGLSEALQALPKFARKEVKNLLKSVISAQLISFKTSLLNPLEEIKKSEEKAKNTLAYKIADYSIDLAFAYIPEILDDKNSQGNYKIVESATSSINKSIEDLAVQNLTTAGVILDYIGKDSIKEKGQKTYEYLKNYDVEKEKPIVASIAKAIVFEPINRVVEKTLEYEKLNKEDFSQKLVSNCLSVVTEYFRNVRSAETKIKEEKGDLTSNKKYAEHIKQLDPELRVQTGRFEKSVDAIEKKLKLTFEPELKKKIENKIFEIVQGHKYEGLSITGDLVNAAIVPLLNPSAIEEVEYQERLSAYGKDNPSLSSVILNEIEENNRLKSKNLYSPVVDNLLGTLFPEGKESLNFIPENLRDQVWKILKEQGASTVLPVIIESLFKPNMINELVLNVLESAETSLLEKPNTKAKSNIVAPNQDPSELAIQAAGLMEVIIDRMEISSIVKNRILDSDGKLKREIVISLDSVLKEQFNENFIETNLKLMVDNLEKKGIQASPILSKEALIQQNLEFEEKIRKKTKNVINLGISKAIDTAWNEAQAKWDQAIESKLGKIGLGLKTALDKVFRFIFFTIIGNILSFIFKPIFRAILHNWLIKTETNIDNLLEPLRRVPSDDFTMNQHMIYNEDLVFKLAKAIQDAFTTMVHQPIHEILKNEGINLKSLNDDNEG